MQKAIRFLVPRLLLLTWFGALTWESGGQTIDIPLQEVQIVAPRKSERVFEMHGLALDTVLRARYYGDDLATVIRRETNINITQYGGFGSLTSIRMRGTSTSHTQVNWNGIPINSPTTGSIDLSLVSSNLADALEVTYGAAGSLFGSGTFGGSINVVNKPDWSNRFSFTLHSEVGSWGHIRGGNSARMGARNWQYHAAVFTQYSPNTYSYHNGFKAGQPRETRVNDTLATAGLQQHLFIRLADHWMLHAASWIQWRDKDLPTATSSQPKSFSNQQDYSNRMLARISRHGSSHSLEFTVAWLTDSLRYEEMPLADSNRARISRIRTSDLPVSLSSRWRLSSTFRLETGADFERMTATGSSFRERLAEYRGSLFSSIRFEKNGFSSNLDMREITGTQIGWRTLYSWSGQYHIRPVGLKAKAQISNKFRLPTLNERYWIPGGNPDLEAETGTGFDLGLSWNRIDDHSASAEASVTAFSQNIDNWIQWVPTGTYWSPRNVRQVRAQGIESDLSLRAHTGIVNWSAKIMYSYTESLDQTRQKTENRLDRQLSYVPFHLLQSSLALGIGEVGTILAYRYCGKRFSTDDHDSWLILEPYHLIDLTLSYRFRFERSSLNLSFKVLNALDTPYEMIRAYPSPGRSFYLSVIYQFNPTKTNE